MADPRDKFIFQTGTRLFNNVDYEIESEGYTESLVEGQPRITIQYRVRWSKSAIWSANMIGSHGTSSSRASKVSRFCPMPFPDGDYAPGIYTQGNTSCPYLGWYVTGVELVDTNDLTCQYQSTGYLQNALKPVANLEPGVDFDIITGDMYDTGYDEYGKPTDNAGSGFATYRVTYEPFQYEVRSDEEMDALPAPLNGCELSRYVIRTPLFGGRAVTIQEGGLYWRDKLLSATGEAARRAAMIPEGYPKILGVGNYRMTWLYVPSVPWATIAAALGKVNAEESGTGEYKKFDYQPSRQGMVLPNGAINGFLKHELLFLGVSEIREVVTAGGQKLFHISYAFEYRPKNGANDTEGNPTGGHNQPFRPNPEGFQRVVRGGTCFPNDTFDSITANWRDIYDEYTMSNLFKL